MTIFFPDHRSLLCSRLSVALYHTSMLVVVVSPVASPVCTESRRVVSYVLQKTKRESFWGPSPISVIVEKVLTGSEAVQMNRMLDRRAFPRLLCIRQTYDSGARIPTSAAQFWRNAANKNGDTLGSTKDKLKQRLLDTVKATERGISTTPEQRQEIDELIAGLEPCESFHLHAPPFGVLKLKSNSAPG